MLGWHISVYRNFDGGFPPADTDKQMRERVAVWQAGIGGLDWIDALVRSGHGRQSGASGYPNRYLISARHVLPMIVEGPPHARKIWLGGPEDRRNEKWVGRTLVDGEMAKRCSADELLLVEAWDES